MENDTIWWGTHHSRTKSFSQRKFENTNNTLVHYVWFFSPLHVFNPFFFLYFSPSNFLSLSQCVPKKIILLHLHIIYHKTNILFQSSTCIRLNDRMCGTICYVKILTYAAFSMELLEITTSVLETFIGFHLILNSKGQLFVAWPSSRKECDNHSQNLQCLSSFQSVWLLLLLLNHF